MHGVHFSSAGQSFAGMSCFLHTSGSWVAE
jgi:hypothetical protein